MTWQPIETAPMDGTPVLVYYDGRQTTAYWDSGEGIGLWKLCEIPWQSYEDLLTMDPTHWHPLPVVEEDGDG